MKSNSQKTTKDDQGKKPLQFEIKLNLPIILLILGILIFIYSQSQSIGSQAEEVNYSEFKNIIQTEQDNIKKAKFEDNGTRVLLKLKSGDSKTVRLPKNLASNHQVLDYLESNKINVQVVPSQGDRIMMFLVNFLPIILIGFFIIIMVKGMVSGGGGGLSFLKSKAKLFKADKVKTTFKDVAGIEEAKNELEEVVEFLKNPKKFQSLGAKIPKGILLVGSPGTGKTLLAKAIAGEADVPFYSIAGSDFVEMFVGLGASRVRDMFEQARKNSPCIIFIDEIDAIGRSRGASGGMGGANSEQEQTLNQMLIEMDGFDGDPEANVIVLAATNRAEVLDKALTRPGRFDREVRIDPPDSEGRHKILQVHSKGKKLSKAINLEVLAKRTPGFTGAQLANVLNEAALIAASKDKLQIENDDIDEAVDKVWMGVKRFLTVPFKELEITAYHEVGHALMALLDENMPLHKVTIIPRASAMGVTWSLSKDDHTHWTKQSLLSRIKVSYGGMVAEELIFNDTTAGVVADLEQATAIARNMVMKFGMSDTLGARSYGTDQTGEYNFADNRNYSTETGHLIDKSVQDLLKNQYTEVKEYLATQTEEMHAVVLELLQKETLDGIEVRNIIKQVHNNEYDFETARTKVKDIESKINNKINKSKSVPESINDITNTSSDQTDSTTKTDTTTDA